MYNIDYRNIGGVIIWVGGGPETEAEESGARAAGEPVETATTGKQYRCQVMMVS